MKIIIGLIVFLSFTLSSVTAQKKKEIMINKKSKIEKTEAEWKAQLSKQEYYVLRKAGTDKPSNAGYTLHFEKGTYVCRACDTQLFESKTKFQSHCGWPSFDDAIEGKIVYKKDNSLGRIRTEIICATCNGHLGHVFDDGPKETTGKRYCVNTSSIKFVK